MKKIIFLCFSLIIVLSIVNAYYPGEKICVEHNLATDQIVYTIVDNVTSIVEPEIIFNSIHINITFPTSMPPQSYKIIFLEETTKEVVVEVPVYHNSGGGSRTKYIEKEVVKEIPKYITEYIVQEEDEEEIDHIDIVDEDYNLKWAAIIAAIILLIIIAYMIKRKYSSKDDTDIDERRYEEYE